MPVRNIVSPWDWHAPLVDDKGRPTVQFLRLWQSLNGNESGTYDTVSDPNTGLDTKVPQTRNINTTAPLAGGGSLAADLTLSHNASGVTAATYGDGTHVGQVTVDAFGHVTAAANVALSQFSATTAGVVPASGGGTTNYLRADGTWAPVSGSGTVTTTGTPASGNLAKFSGATSVTNGDLSGDVTTSGTLATTISSGAVSLSKMANLSANSIIGNNTGSAATPSALTGANVTAMLSPFSSSLQGVVPASGGGTTNFLRADGTWAAPSGGGGSGSGLYSQVMSSTPTQSSTGLSNLVGTGAASSNTSVGQKIAGTSGQAAAYTTSVPATPYSITALLAGNTTNTTPAIGWTDGTKYQFMYVNPGGTLNTNYGQPNVQNNSTLTAFASTAATGGPNYPLRLIWFKIRDDGTNVTFSISMDGANFVSVYSVAKSSGYLGSSGYSHIMVGSMNGNATANDVVVMSWTQGT